MKFRTQHTVKICFWVIKLVMFWWEIILVAFSKAFNKMRLSASVFSLCISITDHQPWCWVSKLLDQHGKFNYWLMDLKIDHYRGYCTVEVVTLITGGGKRSLSVHWKSNIMVNICCQVCMQYPSRASYDQLVSDLRKTVKTVFVLVRW